MQTPGRVQAAIDILTLLEQEQKPVDRIIARYFKDNRYIGSKDKKAITDVVYGVLRKRGFLEWVLAGVRAPSTPRTFVALWLVHFAGEKDLRPIFNGEKYGPQKLWRTEKPVLEAHAFFEQHKTKAPLTALWNCAEWLVPYLERAFGADVPTAMAALNKKAPTDLRVNTLKTTLENTQKSLNAEGYSLKKTPYVLGGIRLEDQKNLFALPIFKNGWFEVQDTASQVLSVLCQVRPGLKVTDFCAGAGGKTLGLAAAMANKGMLCAGDIQPYKLQELKKRLRRAGVSNTQLFNWQEDGKKWLKRHQKSQDLVLVDAPCSGSGVWRRNPDAKWSLTPQRLLELQHMQTSILAQAHKLVKKGGRLIYATCSVFVEENQEQIKAFLEAEKGFKLVPVEDIWPEVVAQQNGYGLCPPTVGGMLQLAPHKSNTDGFFAAILERVE